ncbi:MAG: type II toxin-antitoxin system prevent-host-death family antitoxin [Patescibacteria group bacterium]
MKTKQTIIGLKELRGNTEKYISRVKEGESFIVVRRAQPIFTITSPEESAELWEPLVDFTKINKGGVKLKDVLARL